MRAVKPSAREVLNYPRRREGVPKRGVGLAWETYEKPAVNPKTGAAVTAQRGRLTLIEELPARVAYAVWIDQLLNTIETQHGAH